MAVNLKKFKKTVERRLPILFMLDESGNGINVTEKKLTIDPNRLYGSDGLKYSEKNRNITSMDYVATIMEDVMLGCIDKNILAEISVISYGIDWQFRYPVLTEEEAPYFKKIEDIDVYEMCNSVREISKSKQAVLGSALDLCKAILDDEDTVKTDRYKPVVMVLSTKSPSPGWEEHFNKLLNAGRSSKCQMFWVNIGSEIVINNEKVCYKNCDLDEGAYHIITMKDEESGSSTNIENNMDYSWEDQYTYERIGDLGYKDLFSGKECIKIVKDAKKQMLLGKEYTITDEFGNQFRSIKLQDGNSDNKGYLDTIYIDKRSTKFNGTVIAKEIVDEIKFEPLGEEIPKGEQTSFKVLELEGDFGDGSDSKGDGIA